MFCKWCACPNLPKEFECVNCGEELQSGDAAEIALKRWEELPEDARQEFEEKFKVDQERFRRTVGAGMKNSLMSALIGAGTIGFLGLLTGLMILPEIILGALAGYTLNNLKGGGFAGVLIFGGAYFLSAIGKLVLGFVYSIPGGGIPLFCLAMFFIGQFAAMGVGFGYGLKMNRTHLDRI